MTRVLAVLLVGVLAAAAPAGAQWRQPDTVLGADVDFLGGSLTYARALGPGRYWGLEGGLGGAFVHRMLHAGSHFSDKGGPSYSAEDAGVDNAMVEIVHAGLFFRWAPAAWLAADVGPRASLFLHFDASHETAAFPLFAGGYAALMVGWRNLKFGPRILAGVFSEGSSTREFGVYLVPVSARFSFGF